MLIAAVASGLVNSKALAARCGVDAIGNVDCAHNRTIEWYWYGLAYLPRVVHWQVPQGRSPSDGWPVVYWFEGTSPHYENFIFTPFNRNYLDIAGNLFGLVNEAMTVRTLLDDVYNTGQKYAVIAPAPPSTGIVVQFWNTNCIFPYEISADYAFFNHLFSRVDKGKYGHVNNKKRYATGVSSGGYNTSRMAVTFNRKNNFKALAIQSASYANCAGALCSACAGLAFIPSNHPPTKFYHGVYDPIVPAFTMRCYYDLLKRKGIPTEKLEFTDGGIAGLHGYSTDSYSATDGIQEYFNRYQ